MGEHTHHGPAAAMPRRTGRRPQRRDTRGEILAAARDAFGQRGYDGVSIRAVAASAGVDPALVHYYFGTKERLFLAVVQPPIDPASLMPRLLAGGAEGLSERLLDAFLSVWEDPVSGPAFAALLRGAVSHPSTARLVREFFATQIVRRLMRDVDLGIDPAQVPLRASLVASQLFGLAVIRHLLRFEPLASQPRAAVIAAVAPNLRRYFTGELH